VSDNQQDSSPPKLEDIPDPKAGDSPSSAKVVHGHLIPPQQQILLYAADEWERFLEEWAQFQKSKYQKVARLAGAADMGIDVAGLVDDKGLAGVWDNFQCKHYERPLTPGDAIPEIAKCLWHSYKGRFAPPRTYSFVAPKDCGMSLKKLLLDEAQLRAMLYEKWSDWCSSSITATEIVELDGEFREFVDNFDLSIFTFKPTLELIEEHRQSPYYAPRFGGGLPDRPTSEQPPEQPDAKESRYIEQLFEAYSDHTNDQLSSVGDLECRPDIHEHYHRQREVFYHAESLRNFARDNVPPGTFADLQDEVFAGVEEIEASDYPDGLARLRSVTIAAAQLPLTANSLLSVTKVQDKRGICHQLANEDRLKWVKS
jgi:hypothetical protein